MSSCRKIGPREALSVAMSLWGYMAGFCPSPLSFAFSLSSAWSLAAGSCVCTQASLPPISCRSSSEHSVSEPTPLYLSAPFQIPLFFHPSLQTLYYPRLESCPVLLTECVPGKPPTLDQSNRSLCTPPLPTGTAGGGLQPPQMPPWMLIRRLASQSHLSTSSDLCYLRVTQIRT